MNKHTYPINPFIDGFCSAWLSWIFRISTVALVCIFTSLVQFESAEVKIRELTAFLVVGLVVGGLFIRWRVRRFAHLFRPIQFHDIVESREEHHEAVIAAKALESWKVITRLTHSIVYLLADLAIITGFVVYRLHLEGGDFLSFLSLSMGIICSALASEIVSKPPKLWEFAVKDSGAERRIG